jgi:uncharacterized protein (DUF2384 family)
MGAKQTAKVTQPPELKYQLEHPSQEVIWERAMEVFGEEEKARRWMRRPLPILNHSSPQQYAESNDPDKQREVLGILIAIDYGMYS